MWETCIQFMYYSDIVAFLELIDVKGLKEIDDEDGRYGCARSNNEALVLYGFTNSNKVMLLY